MNRVGNDPASDRVDRARQVLEEAASSTHAFKAQLAAGKLRELKAAALLQATSHKNTRKRLY